MKSGCFKGFLLLWLCLLSSALRGGNLDAPAVPNDAGSAMFSIEDIYQRLLNGSAGDKRGGTPGTFREPAGAPGSTMHTLNEVMEKTPAKDVVDGASAEQVLNGKKFWGLKDGAGWGLLGGTMPLIAISPDSAEVKGGYIATTTLTAIDADLAEENIRSGVTIFGVVGSSTVVNTSTGNATAGEILLNRSAWVNGTQISGRRAGGVSLTGGNFWSGGYRWYKPGNGTVIDCLNGLVWLSQVPHIKRPYLATDGAELDCMRWLYALHHGVQGLTDGSEPGDWDMPTVSELRSLFVSDPWNQEIGSLSSQAFDNPYLMEYYWTSTPLSTGYTTTMADKILVICMRDGSFFGENKVVPNSADWHYVWPIRRIHR